MQKKRQQYYDDDRSYTQRNDDETYADEDTRLIGGEARDDESLVSTSIVSKHHRVKFAKNAPAPPPKATSRTGKREAKSRSKAAFINAPRESANYDVEDMDQSDKENSQSETDQSEYYDDASSSMQNNSVLARQRAIN